MQSRRLHRTIVACVLLTAVTTFALTPMALGQGGGTLNPNAMNNQNNTSGLPAAPAAPQPTLNDEYPTWLGYVVMFLLGAGVISLSVMPSKRSHQD